MKDFQGNPLHVGQQVVIERTTYKGLLKGEVIRLTPMGATVRHRVPGLSSVRYTETNRPSGSIYAILTKGGGGS